MRAPLATHQLSLLREIHARGRVRREDVDGRILRRLRASGLVEEVGDYVYPGVDAGAVLREAGRSPSPPLGAAVPAPRAENRPKNLNETQWDALRLLCRRTEPALADGMDGRTLRALVTKGYLEEKEGWVSVTPAGRAYRQGARAAGVRRARAEAAAPGAARAESILRAVDLLESVLPRDAEVLLGETPAYADDVLHGLRAFARNLGRGGT